MDSERKVPKSRLGRLARLAAVGAKAGAGRLIGRSSETQVIDTAQVLGTLRGLAAKAGQMAAYVDGMVPEEHKGAYESGMRSLLKAAPRSSAVDIRKTLVEELKAPIDQVFMEWNDEPIASASIGQVHLARLQDGREVAVKVQHPGIANAVESDLNNLGLIEGALALSPARKFDPKALFQEVRDRFREELDYSLEGARQTSFRDFHAGDPTIRIPEVFHEFTTGRVLTSEFVRGIDFDEACKASDEEKRAWAETLWRFVYRGNLVAGRFNADPHPGNYLFGENGVVTFLDFGCVSELDEGRRVRALAMHRAILKGDDKTFYSLARELMDTKEGSAHEERVFRQFTDIYRPLKESPYRITRSYASSLLQQMRDLNKESRQSKESEYRPLPKGILFFNRLQFGFYSVLARLDVEVDYAEVERAFLEGAS